MKHDPAPFASTLAGAYGNSNRDLVEDRVRRFLPLVRRTAWHVYGMGRPEFAGALEVEDLIQTGILALTECAQKHSGPTEDGFAAYAKIRVRGAMLDQIRRLLNDSRIARKKRAAYDKTADGLRNQLGREPGRAEIAREMQISDRELLEIEASAVTEIGRAHV